MVFLLIPSFAGWWLVFMFLWFAAVSVLPERWDRILSDQLFAPLVFSVASALAFVILTQRLSFCMVVNVGTAAVGLWVFSIVFREIRRDGRWARSQAKAWEEIKRRPTQPAVAFSNPRQLSPATERLLRRMSGLSPSWLERRIAAEEVDSIISSKSAPYYAALSEFIEGLQQGDEVWKFNSPPETWELLMGRAGFAIVRDGMPVEAVVTRLN